MSDAGTGEDLIERLAGIAPDSPLARLRLRRADIRRRAEACWRALVTPEVAGTLASAERAAVAYRVARAEEDPHLAAHYRALLEAVGTADEIATAAAAEPDGPTRLVPLLRYAERVALHPARLDRAAIDALLALGFTPQDIVAATQLAAFVPFQVRLLAALRAMADRPAPAPHSGPRPGPVPRRPGPYTLDEVGWTPRLAPVDPATATPQQLLALDNCPPGVRRSTYFLTLALDPASLAERGALFDRVMYAPGGLPRAERELATAITSMVNGCVYCTSVHARRFVELTKEAATMRRLLEDGFDAPLDPRRRAIVGFAARLTGRPGAVAAADLHELEARGIEDMALLDLAHAVAMFANANRLMLALGDAAPPA